MAFEPDPQNRAKLVNNIDVSRIVLHDCAVGDKEDIEIPFFASPESDGISSLSAFRQTHKEVTRVRLTTLKRILMEDNIDKIDFLKIDVEGHDLFVLRGFPWDRIKPDVVLCEFEDYKTVPLGYNYHDMGRLLEAQGYQVFLSEWHPIVRYGVTHSWRSLRRYPCELMDARGHGNFVAVRGKLDVRPFVHYLQKLGPAGKESASNLAASRQ